MNKQISLNTIKERVKSFNDDPNLYGVVMTVWEMNLLLDLLEEKDKANENLRLAATAAEKYINGRAIIFSHRNKFSVMYQLEKALEPYRINDDTSSNNEGD